MHRSCTMHHEVYGIVGRDPWPALRDPSTQAAESWRSPTANRVAQLNTVKGAVLLYALSPPCVAFGMVFFSVYPARRDRHHSQSVAARSLDSCCSWLYAAESYDRHPWRSRPPLARVNIARRRQHPDVMRCAKASNPCRFVRLALSHAEARASRRSRIHVGT